MALEIKILLFWFWNGNLFWRTLYYTQLVIVPRIKEAIACCLNCSCLTWSQLIKATACRCCRPIKVRKTPFKFLIIQTNPASKIIWTKIQQNPNREIIWCRLWFWCNDPNWPAYSQNSCSRLPSPACSEWTVGKRQWKSNGKRWCSSVAETKVLEGAFLPQTNTREK